ncbi:hypothetical protein AMK59_4542 [Oryctes borbonicus]|uniref:Uncharacterized protein n=1 Tax=Oryctes borbonicus TaxID=1629725 RepID=A0A0T6B7V2_9SCAR|nr:hypothetical protein AMK59_4542 [Oryctes borbonicus]
MLYSLVEVELMYIACAYETGWKKTISPWCYSFNLETIQPFEYVDDLVQYWYNGYAFKITTRLACLAIRDAVLFFNDRRNRRSANIYFTDISSVIHVLVHLGVYKGKKLNSKTFEMNSKRSWKASKIAGFANNVALIFYS